MKEDFKKWLLDDYGLQESAAISRVANISTIEKYYGDIDSLIEAGNADDLLNDLSYSTADERNNRTPAHKIPINGNIRTGSATLKQALNRYLEFQHATANTSHTSPLEKIYSRLTDVLKQFNPAKKKRSYDRTEVKDYIQYPLLNHLTKEMPDIEWEVEYKPTQDARDSIDIYGKIDNNAAVIIEIDTERADQVCKKFVSRQALSDNQNTIYIALTYPNENCNAESGRKELKKYKNYISSLISILATGSNLEKYIYFHSL